MANSSEKILAIGRRLQSIARNGLFYSQSPYDQERYAELQKIAAELAAGALDADAEIIGKLFSDDTGPATPRVDVRALVIKDGKILLVRDSEEKLWSLPGGWAEVEYTPAQSAEKEVLEESGFQVRAVRCLAVQDNRKRNGESRLFHIYKLFFHCVIEGGEPRTSVETDAVDFFAPDALPPMSLHRSTAPQVRQLFDHAQMNNPEALFD